MSECYKLVAGQRATTQNWRHFDVDTELCGDGEERVRYMPRMALCMNIESWSDTIYSSFIRQVNASVDVLQYRMDVAE